MAEREGLIGKAGEYAKDTFVYVKETAPGKIAAAVAGFGLLFGSPTALVLGTGGLIAAKELGFGKKG
jgi:hypothetical protein